MDPALPLKVPRGSGLNQRILKVLQEYGKVSLTVDFLASVLDRSTNELLSELESLESHGVVKRDGDRVRLA